MSTVSKHREANKRPLNYTLLLKLFSAGCYITGTKKLKVENWLEDLDWWMEVVEVAVVLRGPLLPERHVPHELFWQTLHVSDASCSSWQPAPAAAPAHDIHVPCHIYARHRDVHGDTKTGPFTTLSQKRYHMFSQGRVAKSWNKVVSVIIISFKNYIFTATGKNYKICP